MKLGRNTLWAGTSSPALPAVMNCRTGLVDLSVMCRGTGMAARDLKMVPEKHESNRNSACLASIRRAQVCTWFMVSARRLNPLISLRGSGASAGTRYPLRRAPTVRVYP